jgi:hypothetical protein
MDHAMGLTTVAADTDLTEWIPTRVTHTADGVAISWCWADGARFDEPFWTESATHLMADPFRLLFQHTGNLADLQRHAEQRRAIAPSGFVFHLSRCGSTLVGRALGSMPGVRVLSEPAPLDHMLRAMADRSFREQVAAARWILQALAPVETDDDRHLVVKLDGWHIHQFPILRAAFPDVPWIFLSRDPLEVMVSHERQLGAQMIPGTMPRELLQVPDGDHTLSEYGAHVLAAFLRSAVQHHGDGGLLVDYTELPNALTTRIASHFGLAGDMPSDSVMSVHAKNPAVPFTPDGRSKRDIASASLVATSDQVIGNDHRAFEAARLAQLADEARP